MPTRLSESRSEFIEKNLGLAHACAHRFTNRGVEYDDLFQAGCMGLIKAYDGFDVDRGVKFSTYAVPIILGEIKKIFRDGGSVKVSRQLKELSLKITRTKDELSKKLDREPTIGEIARQLDCDESTVIEAICASRPPVSLTVEDDEDREFDLPIAGKEEDVAELLSLQDAISKLGDEDRRILVLRFYQHKTQTEVAEKLGTTQVQISRKERRIIERLRAIIG